MNSLIIKKNRKFGARLYEKRFTGCGVQVASLSSGEERWPPLTLEVKCVETGLNFSLQRDRVPDHTRAGLIGPAS